MLKPSGAVAGVMVTALLLPACTASGGTGNYHVVPACPHAEAAVRLLGLDTEPFTSVKTYASLGAAGRKLIALGPERTRAEKTLTKVLGLHPPESLASIRFQPSPPPLRREMRRITADQMALAAATGAYYRHRGKPLSIGKAAQRLMRDIHAVQATCSRKHR